MSSSTQTSDMRMSWPDLGPPRLRLDRPVSLVLGGGAVRGLAHVGALEALTEGGVQIREMVGTSVGALILAFYAAVGMDLPAIRMAGLRLGSHHLLAWALLRHAPESVMQRFGEWAGEIPEFMQRLRQASFAQLHHGLERIGIVAHDLVSREEIICHNTLATLRLEDAVRGSVALPGLFPAWKCTAGGREYRLQDGGVVNRLPVDAILRPPFSPEQVLAIDISGTLRDRRKNLVRIIELRNQHPSIPIDVICAGTIGGATVLYGSGCLPRLLELGRHCAIDYLAQIGSKGCAAPASRVGT